MAFRGFCIWTLHINQVRHDKIPAPHHFFWSTWKLNALNFLCCTRSTKKTNNTWCSHILSMVLLADQLNQSLPNHAWCLRAAGFWFNAFSDTLAQNNGNQTTNSIDEIPLPPCSWALESMLHFLIVIFFLIIPCLT